MSIKDNRYCKRVYILISLLAPILYICVNLGRTNGLFFPPDEIGYWENAARMCGLDWSGSTFMQSYYAEGYSILLLPLLKMIQSPLLMYKCALLLNAILFGLNGLVIYAFLKELYCDDPESEICLIALAAIFYPAHFIYMNYTIAETLLHLLVTTLFWMLLRYEHRRRTSDALIAVVVSLTMVFTHFRTIGVAFSAVIMIFAVWRKKKGKSINVRTLVYACGVLMLIAIVFAICPIRSGIAYLDDKLDRFRMVIAPAGILSIIMGIVGKVFYISVSTIGMIFVCVRRIWSKRNESYTGITFLVSFMISIVIFAVFFVNGNGIDYLVYGRYTEIFAPIIMCVGLHEICEADGLDARFGKTSSAGIAISAVLLVIYATFCGINLYRRDFITGLSWVFGYKMPMVNELICIPALLCILAIWIMIWIIRSRSGMRTTVKKWICVAITVFFVFVGIYMSEICVYHYHELDREDVEIFKSVTDMYDNGREVVFLRPPGVNYIGHLQFYMFDRVINYIDGTGPEALTTGPEDVVVTYDNYENRDILSEKYEKMIESPHFVVYFNE